MSTTVGRVDWIAGIDGTLLPSEARRLGNQIGQALGQAASRRASRVFARGLGSDSSFDDVGEMLGRRLADALGAAFRGRFQSAVGDAGASLRRALTAGPMNDFAASAERGVFVMQELRQETDETTKSTNRLRAAATRFTSSLNSGRGVFRRFFAEASDGGRGLGAIIGDLNDRWRSMAHGLRQGIFYTALFINLIPSLAALSSAAGSALLVLGGIVAGFGVGLATTITALAIFAGDIEKLPAELQPARRGLDEMKTAFGELGRAMAVSAFASSEGAWRSLAGTVRALIPAFEEVGEVVGDLTDDLAKELRPGTRTYGLLERLVRRSASTFDRVVRAVGRLGRSLLTAFDNPTFQKALDKTLDYVDLLFDRFDRFVNSPGFDEWIGNGIRIFGAIIPLLDTTARVLNNLVTPASVERLVSFFGNIERFVGTGGAGILEFFSELDIFGIIAKALGDFGAALEPLRQPMIDLASGLRDVVNSGIDTLAPVVEAVATALAPFVQALADFVAQNPKAIADGFIVITGAILGMKLISGVPGVISGFMTKMDELVRTAPTWKTGLAGFASGIIASLTTITSEDQVKLDTFATNIVTALLLGFTLGGGPFGALVAGLTAFVATAVKDALDGGSYALDEFAFKPGDPFYDLVEGWGGMLTGFRDNTLPAWGAAIGEFFGGFFAQLSGQNGTWLDTIVTQWGQRLNEIKANVSGWWNGVVAGWNGFWQTVNNVVSFGWNMITGAWNNAMAIIGNAWNGFWSGLGGIVSRTWSGIVSAVASAVNTVIGLINSLISKVNAGLSAIKNLTGGLIDLKIPSIPGLPRAAAGMITRGPTIAGEAGPEMVIPLRRPLHMINPEVRDAAALLRGQGAGGGIGVQNNVEEGAIVVIDHSGDPRRTGNEVLQRLVEDLAS